MTKTVSISEAQSQLQGLLALTRNGDEVCRYEDVFKHNAKTRTIVEGANPHSTIVRVFAFELYLNT